MSGLELRRLGTTDVLVSELCLGTVTFGEAADEQASTAILDRYLDAGGNFIDTADVYAEGRAEEVIGKFLGGRRDKVVLATKGGMQVGDDPGARGASRRHLVAAAEASLRRLRTDWIDLYQVHLPDPHTEPEETLAALDDLVRSGKVRYVGVSNYACWQLARALGVCDRTGGVRLVSLQAQYSLASRDVELDLVPLCQAEFVGVLAWGALGGGILSGKYSGDVPPAPGTRLAEAPENAHRVNRRTQPIIDELRRVAKETGRTPAQAALRWVLARPSVVAAIVGARTPVQVEDNIGIAGWHLEDDHVRALERVSEPRLVYPHDLQRLLAREP